MPPMVPAYQGPIRQDLNLFELTGQTMGAPAVPLSTEAQALAQLANFMALRQQAQEGAAPPIPPPRERNLSHELRRLRPPLRYPAGSLTEPLPWLLADRGTGTRRRRAPAVRHHLQVW